MRPTRITTLLALFVGTAAVTWGVLRIAETRGAAWPPLAWTAPAFVVLVAVAVLVAALALRRRLGGDRPPNPLGMARMAVLGKASAHVGPLVGGLYGGYLLVLLPALDIDSRRDRALLCLVALGAAVGFTAAGLLLERTCRIRGGDSEPPPAPST